MIQVRDLGDGTFAVIDGMHRVTVLKLLVLEEWLGIDFEHVRHQTILHLSDTLPVLIASA
jgi:ParB-like chromosome segregation protein Spo0J